MVDLANTGLCFVYGTLKHGHHNNYLLRGARFIGKATTVDKFPLVVTELPFLFNVPGIGKRVNGEVYEVHDAEIMARLDRLEGHPNFYYRSTIKVTVGAKDVDAFVYFIRNSRRSFTREDEKYFVEEYRG